jgi:hypothetical protein
MLQASLSRPKRRLRERYQEQALTHGTVLKRPHNFNTADAWVRELNQRGVSCRRVLGTGPSPWPTFRHVDTAQCRLRSGDSLNLWIVKDAKHTLKRHFMNRQRPLFYLWLDNWLVVFPKSVPYKTVLRIRDLFGSKITEGFFYEQ